MKNKKTSRVKFEELLDRVAKVLSSWESGVRSRPKSRTRIQLRPIQRIRAMLRRILDRRRDG
jgi:hypothetical protein